VVLFGRLWRPKTPSGLMFRGLFSDGGHGSLGRAAFAWGTSRDKAAHSCASRNQPGSSLSRGRRKNVVRQTHVAPVLAAGHFTQPGADGGDAIRRYASQTSGGQLMQLVMQPCRLRPCASCCPFWPCWPPSLSPPWTSPLPS